MDKYSQHWLTSNTVNVRSIARILEISREISDYYGEVDV